MLARLCSGLLLLAAPPALLAQVVDLAVTVSVTPRAGLELGDQLLVQTSVVNPGPSAATNVNASVVGVPLQPFPFEIVASETPGCVVETLDIDPVVFNYIWMIGTIPAASERSCVVRLRVRGLPAKGTTSLTVQATSSPVDPNLANNTATSSVTFGSLTPEVVPASSTGSLALFVSLMLASIAFVRIGAKE
jgi:hypothetical protein